MHSVSQFILAASTALSATFFQSASAAPANTSLKIGIVTSITGQYSVYGPDLAAGVRAGVSFATHGTDKIGSHPIQIIVRDDAGDANKAIVEATSLVGEGAKIIGGPIDSSIGLRLADFSENNGLLYLNGLAGANTIVGINKNTFQTARKSYQITAALTEAVDLKPGGSVAVIGQQTNFGKSGFNALSSLLTPRGIKTTSVLYPATTTSFLPMMQKVREAKPDAVFSMWVGNGFGSVWNTINTQEIAKDYPIATELLTYSRWPLFGAAGLRTHFVSPYVYGAVTNEITDWLETWRKENYGNHHIDVGFPSGFIIGQMAIRALSASPDADLNTMIKSLEGWKFRSLQGDLQIRNSDHLLLMPMYVLQMTSMDADPDKIKIKVEKTIPAEKIAPPDGTDWSKL